MTHIVLRDTKVKVRVGTGLSIPYLFFVYNSYEIAPTIDRITHVCLFGLTSPEDRVVLHCDGHFETRLLQCNSLKEFQRISVNTFTWTTGLL